MEWLTSIFHLLSDLLVPESRRLERLISFGQGGLRRALPRAERATEKNTFSVFDYRNKDVKTLVWAVKYKNNKNILELVGKILYEDILAFAEDKMIFENKNRIALVPIPMTPESERKRGWNQSLELCKTVAKLDQGILVLNILEKTKETGHQQLLSRSERLQNIKGSIGLRQGYARRAQAEKDCLLVIIDDVTTTGATISEARQALLGIGLKEVLAVTLAH